MRVACVLITHLRAKVELQRQPHLVNRPVVIVERSGSRPMVADCLPDCAGVTAGMTLEEALSRNTGTIVLDADEPTYQRAFRRVLAALQGVSDRVESVDLGIACVRLDGLERLYGGEDGTLHALLNAVPAYLRPRIGAGDAKFPAFVAARTSDAPGVTHVPPDAAAFLAPRSVDLLPVDQEALDRMHRFGLHTMGDVAAMRPESLIDQFGVAGRRAWELSHGIDHDTVVPLPCEEAVVEHTSLPFASASAEWLLTAVDTLLKRAYARPRMQGRYAGRVTLGCALERAAPWERAINFKLPAGNWEQAAALVRRQLEREFPVAPVEEVTLTLSGITGEAGVQAGLLPDARKDRDLRLLDAERQIQARIGGNHALYRVVDVAPWHPAPEVRAVQVPIDPSGRDGMKPLAVPVPVAVREGAHREPVAVRLGDQWHALTGVEDSWLFDLWWMPQPVSRAYFRVSRREGGSIVLFQDRTDSSWYRQAS
ncbi:MAG: DNA polymerase Y family protein [Chloroflexota bacterium]|nr:DNA polymerase Y family protein [Chloroflexota bacterium]